MPEAFDDEAFDTDAFDDEAFDFGEASDAEIQEQPVMLVSVGRMGLR